MPRLLAGGPGLGASLDHTWLAAASGEKLVLWRCATREAAGSTVIAPGDETDVGFLGARVVTFTRQTTATQVRAFTLPSLEPVAQLEMMGRARPVAIVDDRILVMSEANEQPRILLLTPKLLAADPIPLREPVQLAVAAPEDRLLVASRDQLEAWDPVRRQALFRLNLPLNRPKIAGFAARRRLLWIGSAALPGNIEVFRYSDGRMVLRIDLGQRLLAADGHPESPRLVVAVRGDGEAAAATLFEYDLQLQERRALDGGGGAASFCVVEGSAPALVTANAAGALEWRPLVVAMTPEKPEPTARPRSETAPPARVIAPTPRAGAGAAAGDSSPATSWRSRLGGAAPSSPSTTTHADEDETAAEDEGAHASENESADERANASDDESAQEPIAGPPAGPRSRGDWRSALCDWAQVALGTGRRIALPPVEESSRLGEAVARTGLEAPAACALALLYASWLLGDGERGMAAAQVARAVMRAAGEAEHAWAEALGRGALAQAGLVRTRAGRLRLRAVTTRFLDGAEPRVTIARPSGGQPFVPARGLYLLERSDAALPELPQALADRLGRGVALVVPSPSSSLPPEAVVEARLHDAVPLVMVGDDAPGDWAETRNALTVLVALDADAAGLGHLPTLALP